MDDDMMYLYDPSQLPEFGYNFYEGDGFTYRYQSSKRLFFKSFYIPLGPNCPTEQGFDNFLQHTKSLRFTKVKIDLPMIYNTKHAAQVVDKIKKAGFTPATYIQDEETLVVVKEDMNLKHSEMNQIRNGLKKADIVVKKTLDNTELDQLYDIYLIAAKRLEITPKNKSVFKRLADGGLTALAYDKETNELEGFLLNCFTQTDLSDITKKGDTSLLLLMFTGLTDKGRDLQLGRAIYYELFRYAFEHTDTNVIDFHGASRSKGRSYMGFKTSFSKRFISLPGSFTHVRFF
jgi:hypothetical protein